MRFTSFSVPVCRGIGTANLSGEAGVFAAKYAHRTRKKWKEESNKPAQMLRTEWHRRQSCDAHTPHVSCSLAQDLSSWAVSNESQAD